MDEAIGAAVMARIAELRSWRRWYLRQPNPDVWADLAALGDIELRALLRVLREARRRPRNERVALAQGEHFAGMPR